MIVTREAFCYTHQVRLRPKSELRLMRFTGWLLSFLPKLTDRHGNERCRGERFMQTFWTTFRLPWQPKPTIAYPDGVDPMRFEYAWLREHELYHCNRIRTLWGLIRDALLVVLIPFPIVLSGRWFIERHAYLIDFRAGVKTPEKAARILWEDYLMAWPQSWAVRWWKAKLSA